MSKELGEVGQILFDTITADYEYDEDEMTIFYSICRTVDVMDRLESAIEEKGTWVRGANGAESLNPAIQELRMQRKDLVALWKSLGHLDQSEPMTTTARARKAARARWDR